MKNKTRMMILAALFAALSCVATMVIRIPTPIGGYIHAGDAVVLLSAFLLGPWAQDTIEYQIAVVLLALGVVLWLVNFLYGRLVTGRRTRFQHPEDIAHLEDIDR